jgi:hypothetical protein
MEFEKTKRNHYDVYLDDKYIGEIVKVRMTWEFKPLKGKHTYVSSTRKGAIKQWL